MDAKIRLHVDHALAAGQAMPLTEGQAHYLFGVMRLGVGAGVLLFNGRDGEWRAEVAVAGKRAGVLVCVEQVRRLQMPPDLWLLFAPLKKARTDFVVEKAVELGVARIMPVQTRFTNAERLRRDKLYAHAVEAAEQCGATVVPEVAEIVALDKVLDGWPADRRLLWCDETLAGGPSAALAGDVGMPWAILIGPEGGFAEVEKARLRAMPQVVPLSLGPRILRAETAAVAALTLWQASLGDWR
jgi:16S rRNA (uracil1498-N3)-methyltransferase